MEFKPTAIPGVVEIIARPLSDDRGRFMKPFTEEAFRTAGLPTHFVEHYCSTSKKNVLRGMHFQNPPRAQGKLVVCALGKVLDVALDLRVNSPTFGKAAAIELDETLGNALFIPAGCAHGFYVLSEQTAMTYSVTDIYDPTRDAGIRWDSFGFPWPATDPILSAKDANAPPLSAFHSPF